MTLGCLADSAEIPAVVRAAEQRGTSVLVFGDELSEPPDSLTSSTMETVSGIDVAVIRHPLTVGPAWTLALIARINEIPIVDSSLADADLDRDLKNALRAGKRRRHLHSARKRVEDHGLVPGPRALLDAISSDSRELLEALLVLGMSPDFRDENGTPAVCLAARSASWTVLRALIRNKADLTAAATDRGTNILHELAVRRAPEWIPFCVERGAPVDHISASGQTPLIAAAASKDEVAARTLLESGSPVDVADALGMTAAKYASLYQLTELERAIAERTGGKIG